MRSSGQAEKQNGVMTTVEDFINAQVNRYRTQVLRQKHGKRGVSLDALERAKRRSYFACRDEILRCVVPYDHLEFCRLSDMAHTMLEAVDEEQFSPFQNLK